MKRFDKHILICENVREEGHPRGSCGTKNSPELVEAFKKRLKQLGLNSFVRANKSGCLDACEFGPVVLVYPGQYWYGGVKIEDVEEIIQQHIINNKPVEKLLIKDKRFNRDQTNDVKEEGA
jgi:(2Fe-2S) ferredoxin